jgi:hypothetical protein
MFNNLYPIEYIFFPPKKPKKLEKTEKTEKPENNLLDNIPKNLSLREKLGYFRRMKNGNTNKNRYSSQSRPSSKTVLDFLQKQSKSLKNGGGTRKRKRKIKRK